MICQTKTILISTYNNNLLTDLLIRQTFFRQRFKQSEFAKLSPYTSIMFELNGVVFNIEVVL